ncbi:Uncharacterized protein TCM_045512 [Theobroma cacao]|uniref:RNase H type-1 domain-containing protein n=1 Tax=Theobroma cacao TaxID=3641 RepID=A0A061FS21_THECC|nr:Uncharacterized protein TCM_045512 [Theobroma cacao]
MVGFFPFTYLGFLMGANPRRVSFWDLVTNKVRQGLALRVHWIPTISHSNKMPLVWKCIKQLPTNDKVVDLVGFSACQWCIALALSRHGSLSWKDVLNSMLTDLLEVSLVPLDVELLFESDSKVALSWVSDVRQRPWKLWQIFNEIDYLSRTIGNVSYINVLREGNSFADSLGKLGLDRCSMFTALCSALTAFLLLLCSANKKPYGRPHETHVVYSLPWKCRGAKYAFRTTMHVLELYSPWGFIPEFDTSTVMDQQLGTKQTLYGPPTRDPRYVSPYLATQ